MPDALDLVEIRWRSRAQPINECLERSSAGVILCIEFAKPRLSTTQDQLGERWRLSAEPRAKRLECGGERRCLGNRMARMRGRHAASVARYSTDDRTTVTLRDGRAAMGE